MGPGSTRARRSPPRRGLSMRPRPHRIPRWHHRFPVLLPPQIKLKYLTKTKPHLSCMQLVIFWGKAGAWQGQAGKCQGLGRGRCRGWVVTGCVAVPRDGQRPSPLNPAPRERESGISRCSSGSTSSSYRSSLTQSTLFLINILGSKTSFRGLLHSRRVPSRREKPVLATSSIQKLDI